MSYVHTRRLEKEMIDRNLLPAGCKLVEVSMSPSSALVIRYEVFVTAEQLGAFADAMKAAADETIADNERHRLAQEKAPA